jgi:16S rRNA (uracil1498-N3)-methyltransferase
MRRRFFVERFDGQAATLRGESAAHLGRVLRAQPGQLYELSDGAQVWLGRVERVARDAVEFSLVEQLAAREPALHIVLLLSIVKFDRFEWALEKATELGVAEVIPLAAARSERALITAAAKRARRWEKILRESAQQARRLRPPVLHALISSSRAFVEVGEQHAAPLHKPLCRILLSERAEAPPLRSLLEGKAPPGVVVAIGPEGGWTEEEFAAALEAGFREASLGSLILRTETAVAAALAILNYALGDSGAVP